MDSNIIVALIGFAGAILAALIAIGALPVELPYILISVAAILTATGIWFLKKSEKKDPNEEKPNPPAPIPVPASIPTPTTTLQSLHQLPAPTGDFTGRTEELAELLDKVKQGGVSISGIRGSGGIGKTQLALKLAQSLKPDYPDAQFYLDLKGVSEDGQDPLSPAEALTHIIRAFEPKAQLPAEVEKLLPFYNSLLDSKKTLLLMDNARDAEQVLQLVPPDGSVLIITSRKKFHLAGLHSQDLDVLSETDAIALLRKNAPRIGDHAGEIARLCGCYPLALSLAGGTLKERPTLSLPDYIEKLRTAEALKPVDRSLETSCSLLEADERKHWQQLSVFPGSFDWAGATAVWGIEAERAKALLGDLNVLSLIEWNTEASRYHLHDLARVYAARQLNDEEGQTAQQRHAEHYKNQLAYANQLYEQGGDQVLAGLNLFDLERENIERGQSWAAAHAEKHDQAARLCSDYPNAGVYVLELRLHPQEHIRWLETALASARKLQDKKREGAHLNNLGLAYAALGETQDAIKRYEQALDIFKEIGDRRGEGNALGSLGLAHAALGKTQEAIKYYKQALVICKEIGDRRGEGNALGNLGPPTIR